ncbi:hypothetical protein HF078_14725 [Bacillus sp. RO2]|uniref:ABC transporter substrate-binding protein n=1 Tax=Bacillus sp. RO2 TaxID=2723913 RepID=UPI00145FA57A|nr:ABC transporter substrate-binding protein [Bacillus sp. RO2]NMH74343.1 hypothetical protein [Bacillus sp. RO2]
MKKRLNILSIIAIVLILLVGCTSESSTDSNTNNKQNDNADTEEPKQGGSITIASASEPGNLNPLIWATSSDTLVTHMIYDSLVIPDEELKMIGSLAEKWDVSEDGKTYTFYLHEGVTWHDGKPFTARDVEFTYTSLAHPDYDAGAYWRVDPVVGAAEYKAGEADSVEGIKVIDDYTISFTTKEQFAPFISGLFIGVLPEHILSEISPAEWAKHDSNRAPVGTGPFKFDSWESGQFIQLSANKDYFKGTPHLDSLVVRFGDANTMLAAFMNKEIDITSVPIAEIESIKSLDYANVVLSDQLSVYYVGFNAKNDHFSDVKVRQALAHATEKRVIVASILGEYGEVADDIFPSKHWSHSPDLPIYDFDKSKAESLLEEAGYKKNSKGIFEKNGKELSFTLQVPTGTKEREKTAALLKQQYEAIGVKMELLSLDFPTLVTKLLPQTADGKQREVTKDDYDAYILGFGIEADPDEYRSYFGSAYMPPNGYNFVGYSDSLVDELLDKQSKEVDFEQRQKYIWEVSKKLAEDEIWIPIYEQSATYVANEKVAGFTPDFRGVTFNAREWSVK